MGNSNSFFKSPLPVEYLTWGLSINIINMLSNTNAEIYVNSKSCIFLLSYEWLHKGYIIEYTTHSNLVCLHKQKINIITNKQIIQGFIFPYTGCLAETLKLAPRRSLLHKDHFTFYI